MKIITDNLNEKLVERMRLAFKTVLSFFVLICTLLACRYVLSIIQTTPFHEIKEAIIAIPPMRLFAAVLLVGVTYLIMTAYDTLGLRLVGSRLPYRQIAFVSFIGDTINANMGLSAFVGSAVKLRFYMARGESVTAIVRAIASYTAAYWAGFSLLFSFSGIASLIINSRSASTLHSPVFTGLTIVASMVTILYLTACLSSARKKIPAFVPQGTSGLKLLAVGISDWSCSALIFFLLIPDAGIVRFPEFINLYLYSHAVGMVSQSPGGFGVFESVCLMMSRHITPTAMLGALFTFRLLFFIFPLCAALSLLGMSKVLKLFALHGSGGMKNNGRTRPFTTSSPVLPFVSVVVPAYNEERFLPACLSALSGQEYAGRREIIVVDNASTDTTAAIAAAHGCRIVHEPLKGYNRAITAGFNAAKGDIIACTDADTVVPENWLSTIVTDLSNENVVACGGLFKFHDGPFWLKLMALFFGKFNYHISGANMAVWKHAYLRSGGFSLDVNLGADVEIGKRLKRFGDVVIDRSLVVATSSRRFARAFWKTVVMYYVNDFYLLFLNRPLFRSFRDYRTLKPAGFPGRSILPAAMTLFLIMFSGQFTEPPFNRMTGTTLASGACVRAVALTFDDGPGAGTEKILDILDHYGVKATFFVIGKNAERHHWLLKKMAEQGHEIGNHSYTHSLKFSIESPRTLKKELDSTAATIYSATGSRPVLFRPPRGWKTPWMIRECSAIGYHMVLWTVDSQDWLHVPRDRIVENVIRKTRPGSIILLHDRLNTGMDKEMANTIEALPAIIEVLSREGFIFMTISEILDIAPVNSSLEKGVTTVSDYPEAAYH
ncbi:MAG: polysaccharide deacetylase family protein [Chitinispirillaceae bacterium]|nr:polysaccharide deacetylase family protein [Chitinispirillaceae bacterium]